MSSPTIPKSAWPTRGYSYDITTPVLQHQQQVQQQQQTAGNGIPTASVMESDMIIHGMGASPLPNSFSAASFKALMTKGKALAKEKAAAKAKAKASNPTVLQSTVNPSYANVQPRIGGPPRARTHTPNRTPTGNKAFPIMSPIQESPFRPGSPDTSIQGMPSSMVNPLINALGNGTLTRTTSSTVLATSPEVLGSNGNLLSAISEKSYGVAEHKNKSSVADDKKILLSGVADGKTITSLGTAQPKNSTAVGTCLPVIKESEAIQSLIPSCALKPASIQMPATGIAFETSGGPSFSSGINASGIGHTNMMGMGMPTMPTNMIPAMPTMPKTSTMVPVSPTMPNTAPNTISTSTTNELNSEFRAQLQQFPDLTSDAAWEAKKKNHPRMETGFELRPVLTKRNEESKGFNRKEADKKKAAPKKTTRATTDDGFEPGLQNAIDSAENGTGRKSTRTRSLTLKPKLPKFSKNLQAPRFGKPGFNKTERSPVCKMASSKDFGKVVKTLKETTPRKRREMKSPHAKAKFASRPTSTNASKFINRPTATNASPQGSTFRDSPRQRQLMDRILRDGSPELLPDVQEHFNQPSENPRFLPVDGTEGTVAPITSCPIVAATQSDVVVAATKGSTIGASAKSGTVVAPSQQPRSGIVAPPRPPPGSPLPRTGFSQSYVPPPTKEAMTSPVVPPVASRSARTPNTSVATDFPGNFPTVAKSKSVELQTPHLELQTPRVGDINLGIVKPLKFDLPETPSMFSNSALSGMNESSIKQNESGFLMNHSLNESNFLLNTSAVIKNAIGNNGTNKLVASKKENSLGKESSLGDSAGATDSILGATIFGGTNLGNLPATPRLTNGLSADVTMNVGTKILNIFDSNPFATPRTDNPKSADATADVFIKSPKVPTIPSVVPRSSHHTKATPTVHPPLADDGSKHCSPSVTLSSYSSLQTKSEALDEMLEMIKKAEAAQQSALIQITEAKNQLRKGSPVDADSVEVAWQGVEVGVAQMFNTGSRTGSLEGKKREIFTVKSTVAEQHRDKECNKTYGDTAKDSPTDDTAKDSPTDDTGKNSPNGDTAKDSANDETIAGDDTTSGGDKTAKDSMKERSVTVTFSAADDSVQEYMVESYLTEENSMHEIRQKVPQEIAQEMTPHDPIQISFPDTTAANAAVNSGANATASLSASDEPKAVSNTLSYTAGPTNVSNDVPRPLGELLSDVCPYCMNAWEDLSFDLDEPSPSAYPPGVSPNSVSNSSSEYPPEGSFRLGDNDDSPPISSPAAISSPRVGNHSSRGSPASGGGDNSVNSENNNTVANTTNSRIIHINHSALDQFSPEDQRRVAIGLQAASKEYLTRRETRLARLGDSLSQPKKSRLEKMLEWDPDFWIFYNPRYRKALTKGAMMSIYHLIKVKEELEHELQQVVKADDKMISEARKEVDDLRTNAEKQQTTIDRQLATIQQQKAAMAATIAKQKKTIQSQKLKIETFEKVLETFENHTDGGYANIDSNKNADIQKAIAHIIKNFEKKAKEAGAYSETSEIHIQTDDTLHPSLEKDKMVQKQQEEIEFLERRVQFLEEEKQSLAEDKFILQKNVNTLMGFQSSSRVPGISQTHYLQAGVPLAVRQSVHAQFLQPSNAAARSRSLSKEISMENEGKSLNRRLNVRKSRELPASPGGLQLGEVTQTMLTNPSVPTPNSSLGISRGNSNVGTNNNKPGLLQSRLSLGPKQLSANRAVAASLDAVPVSARGLPVSERQARPLGETVNHLQVNPGQAVKKTNSAGNIGNSKVVVQRGRTFSGMDIPAEAGFVGHQTSAVSGALMQNGVGSVRPSAIRAPSLTNTTGAMQPSTLNGIFTGRNTPAGRITPLGMRPHTTRDQTDVDQRTVPPSSGRPTTQIQSARAHAASNHGGSSDGIADQGMQTGAVGTPLMQTGAGGSLLIPNSAGPNSATANRPSLGTPFQKIAVPPLNLLRGTSGVTPFQQNASPLLMNPSPLQVNLSPFQQTTGTPLQVVRTPFQVGVQDNDTNPLQFNGALLQMKAGPLTALNGINKAMVVDIPFFQNPPALKTSSVEIVPTESVVMIPTESVTVITDERVTMPTTSGGRFPIPNDAAHRAGSPEGNSLVQNPFERISSVAEEQLDNHDGAASPEETLAV